MSDSFAANLVRIAVAQVLHQAGFERVQDSACAVLSDLLVRFLDLLATRASEYSQLQGRTVTNLEDASRSLQELGVDPEGLRDFCRAWAKRAVLSPSTDLQDTVGSGTNTTLRGTGGLRFTKYGGSLPLGSEHDGNALTPSETEEVTGFPVMEPGAFPINIDELGRMSGETFTERFASLPDHHEHLSTRETSENVNECALPPTIATGDQVSPLLEQVPASPGVNTSSPALGPPDDENLSGIDPALHFLLPSETRKRKRANYECIIPFEKSKLARSSLDVLLAPPFSPSEANELFPSVPEENSRQLYKGALAAVRSNKNSCNDEMRACVPLKRVLPLMQQRRRRTLAVPDDTVFGSNRERGILDDLLALALPNLPGLLEGQPPQRSVGINGVATQSDVNHFDVDGQLLHTKRRKGAVNPELDQVVHMRSSPVLPRRLSTSVGAGEPASQPKIRLKLSLSAMQPFVPTVPMSTGTTLERSPVHVIEQTSCTSATVYNHEDIINCICRNPHVDDGGFMIACDRCGVWYHGHCVGLPSEKAQGVGDWFCPRCSSKSNDNMSPT
ncbi:hypothetical protein SpCBS45565_g07244 [Spizellomyces sp. 'palustris']|nr:hypothetical protein SpCBS45565_g07244 [Spizellomyces sp. 'palustris']